MDESLKKQAYSIGLKLKNSGIDSETIFARLEKSGIPEEMAKQVVENIMLEQKKELSAKKDQKFNKGIIYIVSAVVIALVTYLLLPGVIILPIGLVIGGIILAYISKRN